jgi:hypothetical protein
MYLAMALIQTASVEGCGLNEDIGACRHLVLS